MDGRRPVAVLAVLVTGCGVPGDASSQQVEATRDAEDWVATDRNSVALLRWTEDEPNQISGALQLAELVEYEVQGQSWPVAGVVGNTEITLTVEGLLGTGSTVTGDYSRNEVTLYWPEDGWSMSAVLFHRGTISEYSASAEMALMAYAQTILDTTGPAAISEHRSHVDELLAEGTELIEYAKSLVE